MTPTQEQIWAILLEYLGPNKSRIAAERITAVAGVEEKPRATFPHGTLLINTTIERCAKVIIDMLNEKPDDTGMINGPSALRRIRALKEKP